MAEEQKESKPPGESKKRRTTMFLVLVVITAAVSALVTALLVNIFERKQEAKNPYLRVVDVTEDTVDSAMWGSNWPREFDGYKQTVQASSTNFGGGDAHPAEKAEKEPWLTRMFAGYAFAIDYRDRRGHAYMLFDQEHTRRVTEKPQPGACLHCHASIIPAYRFVGKGDVMKGFEEVCAMPYQKAHDLLDDKGNKLISHPVGCVDCHDAKTMELRVTRPGFLVGIKAIKEHQGTKDYDVNRDATRQEMRSFVCGQCHVEYYFKGDGKTVTYPWSNGLKVEEIEKYYDDMGFTDWKHKETGAPVLKAQHPEFEMWNQGIHARSGVSCADCHMPYKREGALKISDHWVRSPLLNKSRACQQCHHYPEEEIQARADLIQQRTHTLMRRSAAALVDMLDSINDARKAGAGDEQLKAALAFHRKAQWRLDFVAAENSMGFHAPQEAARILAEAVDYARQGQISAKAAPRPATQLGK
ncbi:MAG TPA: ammonia-forming cytochrome c nitrite reductase subunit c552 [Tepidisphaeraceae bacterium]|jgi:nitrite reductase (cytochrome c-552)|nr:ammonia-forming cytochrome c nitrite reductase subunit c552 [Tepidisphaeraceae bacterium]